MLVRKFSGCRPWGYSKGFIRVIEIIIFSVILFFLIIPTFFYYSEENDWGEINNLILCNDLLYSMERNKTFDNILNPFDEDLGFYEEHEKDLELLRNITEKVFPVVFDFEYEIKNVAPYKISIGCNCTSGQITWLNNTILTSSYPTAEFNIEPIALSNLSANLSEFNASKYDLFIIFGEKDLSTYQSNITAMLELGKGFVLIRDFSSAPDIFTEEIFGIDYSGGVSSIRELKFNDLSTPRTAGIAKRFVNNLVRIDTSGIGNTGEIQLKDETYGVDVSGTKVNITNCSPIISEGQTCTITGVGKISLSMIGPSDNWIDIKISGVSNPRDYRFYDTFPQTVNKNEYTILSYSTKTGANARVLESYSNSYETEPRTFWIYDYDKNDDDLNLLLKTGIIWASGEHYFVFDRKITDKRNYCQHFYSGMGGNNIPFLVKLYFFD